MMIWRRIKRKGRSGVAHTLHGDRPNGTMSTVCHVALSLAGDYVQASESARDCKRCAKKRTNPETPGEKIGRKVKRSLYDPGSSRR